MLPLLGPLIKRGAIASLPYVLMGLLATVYGAYEFGKYQGRQSTINALSTAQLLAAQEENDRLAEKAQSDRLIAEQSIMERESLRRELKDVQTNAKGLAPLACYLDDDWMRFLRDQADDHPSGRETLQLPGMGRGGMPPTPDAT